MTHIAGTSPKQLPPLDLFGAPMTKYGFCCGRTSCTKLPHKDHFSSAPQKKPCRHYYGSFSLREEGKMVPPVAGKPCRNSKRYLPRNCWVQNVKRKTKSETRHAPIRYTDGRFIKTLICWNSAKWYTCFWYQILLEMGGINCSFRWMCFSVVLKMINGSCPLRPEQKIRSVPKCIVRNSDNPDNNASTKKQEKRTCIHPPAVS